MSYQEIDLSRHPRRDHFARFLEMDSPIIDLTVQVDITRWFHRLRQQGCPFFLSFQYAVAQAANAVPELRQRIVDGGIVQFDFCDPSYTVALPDGTYRFCLVNAHQPFSDYLAEGQRKQAQALQAERLEEEVDPLGLLFTTCLPWVSYTSMQMPWPSPHFSNPNIGWGKYTVDHRLRLVDGQIMEEEIVTLPVTLMANHALVDGIHMARFYENLNRELDRMFF